MAPRPHTAHFTIEEGGVINADSINIQLGDELVFRVTDVNPMEDGTVGITLQFEEVL
jgi:hypothetical protein